MNRFFGNGCLFRFWTVAGAFSVLAFGSCARLVTLRSPTRCSDCENMDLLASCTVKAPWHSENFGLLADAFSHCESHCENFWLLPELLTPPAPSPAPPIQCRDTFVCHTCECATVLSRRDPTNNHYIPLWSLVPRSSEPYTVSSGPISLGVLGPSVHEWISC